MANEPSFQRAFKTFAASRHGIDAPICQDTRSGGLDDLLASAEIGHDALVDLASEETFQAPDDLSLGLAVRRAACDVINGRLMVPHADDDGSIEGGVGVSVAVSIEAVPAGGHPGRGRDRTRAPRTAVVLVLRIDVVLVRGSSWFRFRF